MKDILAMFLAGMAAVFCFGLGSLHEKAGERTRTAVDPAPCKCSCHCQPGTGSLPDRRPLPDPS